MLGGGAWWTGGRAEGKCGWARCQPAREGGNTLRFATSIPALCRAQTASFPPHPAMTAGAPPRRRRNTNPRSRQRICLGSVARSAGLAKPRRRTASRYYCDYCDYCAFCNYLHYCYYCDVWSCVRRYALISVKFGLTNVLQLLKGLITLVISSVWPCERDGWHTLRRPILLMLIRMNLPLDWMSDCFLVLGCFAH
jgi:hypothetical protein